jgi:5-methylcytosine-specific restriction endonuclease McrA
MKKYKIKKCIYCGGDIIKGKTESIPYYQKRKFCKLSCQHKWNTENNSSDIKCKFCGKVFRRRNFHIKKNNFCSLICARKYKTKAHNLFVKCDWCDRELKKPKSAILKHNFCSRKCMGEWQSKFRIGENSYNWRNGADTINHRIRSIKKNTEWILEVFKRDNFTCQKCGDKRGGNLNAHHLKPVSIIIKEHQIKEMIDAIKCKELWNIDNGITLCESCHIKEHKKI